MGWFSTEKKTYVSTVTYPLGNDDADERVDILKYTVLNAVLQNQPIAQTVTNTYLGGQGLKLRQAYAYARDNYAYGLPQTGYFYNERPDKSGLHTVLRQLHPEREIMFLQVLIGFADFTWWAERFLAHTYGYDRVTKRFAFPPKDITEDATVAYDIRGGNQIEILLMNPGEGGFIKTVIFTPNDLSTRTTHVHACYRTIEAFPTEEVEETRPFEEGDVTGVTVTQPTEDVNQELRERHITRTVTTDGTTTTVKVRTAMRILSRPRYFLYRVGAGTYPALDSQQDISTMASPYYPSIPLRVDNKTMEELHGGAYRWKEHELNKTATKLLKKVGVDYEDLQDKLKENQSIKEIDFAFLVFGVSLNTKSPEGKKYLYQFFSNMHAQQLYGKAEFDAWAAEQNEVCLPYPRQPNGAANVALLDPMNRLPVGNADVNLCEALL